MPWIARISLAVLLAVSMRAGNAAGGPDTPAEGPRCHDPRDAFVAFQPMYRELKKKYRDEYQALRKRLAAEGKGGRTRNCSRQVLDEAEWLLHYTADFEKLEKRLLDLSLMLDAKADPHPSREQSPDGSFGCCSNEWFFKLARTDDVVLVQELKGRPAAKPTAFLDRINSPQKLQAYLEPLLTSDVAAKGIDHRYELSHSASILTRFLAWKIPSNYEFHPDLEEALFDFEDSVWQDPRTGYWGAWYRSGGEVIKTADLSTTFHIVHYREGKVKRWPEIIRTTLAIRDREYPCDWLEDGKMSNHHNYDVAAILHLGWPHMNPADRKEAAGAIERMLEFCLRETPEEDGSFKMLDDESTVAGAQLFGVSLLSEVGYFDKKERFWTEKEFPDAEPLRKKIRANLKKLGTDDPEVELALLILAAAEWGF